MVANLATASIKATGSSSRSVTLGDRFAEIINVKDYGAIGNGLANDRSAIQAALDAAFGTSGSPHGGSDIPGSSYYLNRQVYFPPGKYIIDAPLTVTSVQSGRIFGAGMLASFIQNTTTGSVCFRTNGCANTTFEYLSFKTAAGSNSVAFWLGWTNTGTVALTSNVFNLCYFSGDIGLLLGGDGAMGSENLITRCTFTNCGTAGIKSVNGNMLDTSVIACSISDNPAGYGIWIQTGQIENIQQCSLANNLVDIQIDAGSFTNIMGCRSESPVFCAGGGGLLNIETCTQTPGPNATPSYFLKDQNGTATLTNCLSYGGKIGNANTHGDITIIGCNFDFGASGITGAANNGSGLIRLTIAANYWATGDQVVVWEVGGVTAANGSWTVTVIDSTHVDLQGSTFSGTWTPTTATVTITIASPGVITDTSHGLLVNTAVFFQTTGALPTGITANVPYYVKTVLTANTYTISASPGGTVIATTGSQSGTHTRIYSGGHIVHPGYADASLNTNYYRNSGSPAAAISYYRENRVTKTASYAIPRFLSGAQFDNIGASGTVTFTLPSQNEADAFKRGTVFGFYVGAAQTLEIFPSNGMTLRVAGSVSTATTGKVSSNTVGNYIEITCIDGGRDIVTGGIDATKWVAKSVVGTWTVT